MGPVLFGPQLNTLEKAAAVKYPTKFQSLGDLVPFLVAKMLHLKNTKQEVISFHSWLENAKINRDRGERSVVQNPNFVHKVNLSKNQHRGKTNFEKSEKEIRKYLKDFLCKFQKCTFMRIPFDSPSELYLRYKKKCEIPLLKPNRKYFAILQIHKLYWA